MRPPPVRHEWITSDGSSLTIRAITPEDREIEQAFVRNLSANSKYLRFFSAIKELTPRMLDRFTQVDFPREMAFIATVTDSDTEREIGVARYAPGSGDKTAEFAVVVADEWQGRGIGGKLLLQLIDMAKETGFERLEGVVLKSNEHMLALCRHLGFAVSPYAGDVALMWVSRELQS